MKIIAPNKNDLFLLDLDELNLIRQWYNAVEDFNPKYLEGKDKILFIKIKDFVDATKAEL